MKSEVTTSPNNSRLMQVGFGLGYVAITAAIFFLGTDIVSAADDLGQVAEKVTSTLGNVAKLVTAASYVAGMGFALSGIVKFKAHKDAPTQVPLSAPIVMVVIAAALLFLPSILKMAGSTLFGDAKESGTASGFGAEGLDG